MAIRTGVSGNAVLPTLSGAPATIHITRWNATIARDIHDVSVFQGTPDNARRKQGGMYDLKGSAEGHCDSTAQVDLDAANSIQIEDAVPITGFVLTSSTGRTLSFTGLLSTIRWGIEKVGQATLAFDFESSGEVTEA